MKLYSVKFNINPNYSLITADLFPLSHKDKHLIFSCHIIEPFLCISRTVHQCL